MKTDDLIAMLAADTAAAPRAARRFVAAMAGGLAGAVLLMVATLGVRPDLAQAAALPMFWMKLLAPALAAAAAFRLMDRLAVPGRRPGVAPAAVIGALLLTAWTAAAAVLLSSAPEQRLALVHGVSWKTCTRNIGLLSLPLLAAAFWALRGWAPTRLALTGGCAGLFAGAAAAVVYALHCPEMAAPFLGIWYVLGVLTPAVLGTLLGPHLLRW
jgi:hypothetical protein